VQDREVSLLGGFTDADNYGGVQVEATMIRVSLGGLRSVTLGSSQYEPLAFGWALGHAGDLVVLGGI
jgi:hypothetical protein